MNCACTVSIISHNQAALVVNLVDDLQAFCGPYVDEVIVTINIAEEVRLDVSQYDFPIRVLRNLAPKGFGANHNAAFLVSSSDFFAFSTLTSA